MQEQSLSHTFNRYRTLYTHKISVLPIAILMPHSACNCRCIMCDIWKGNKNSKQLEMADIKKLLVSLKKLDTKRIVMSGGEALLNKDFFRFCELIKEQDIKITLLSTGITVGHSAEKILDSVDELIVSLDGDETLHDLIRNIKGAFGTLRDGVQKLKRLKNNFRITARCVIHNYNYKSWDKIILAAKEMKLDQISFLPADVSSQAFNRLEVWGPEKQNDILIKKNELPGLQEMIQKLMTSFETEFNSGFIAESQDKIQKIYAYYAAYCGLGPFPEKKCNAPWVSVVVEADGTVKPCFFHDALGTIKEMELTEILNSKNSVQYRRSLNVQTNPTCGKCVCSLNLSPSSRSY